MDIAIIGASGYTGGELMRLLLNHSSAEVVAATSRKLDGTPVASVHPHLQGLTDLVFGNIDAGDIDADFVFLAVPHTVAMKVAGVLVERGIRTVDLSADYRLAKDVYEKIYGVRHVAYFEAPYGLPELHRDEIRGLTSSQTRDASQPERRSRCLRSRSLPTRSYTTQRPGPPEPAPPRPRPPTTPTSATT